MHSIQCMRLHGRLLAADIGSRGSRSPTLLHSKVSRRQLLQIRCQSPLGPSNFHQRSPSGSTRHRAPRWPSAIALVSIAGLSAYFWQSDDTSKSKRLSYATFTSLIVDDIKPITQDSSIISLLVRADQLPDPSIYPDPCDTPLQAIYIRQPELQIQRAYTPLDLSALRTEGDSEATLKTIKILVKKYNDGEVSSFLHRLRKGDAVDVRGPVRTWTLPLCSHLIYVRPSPASVI